MKKLIYHRKNIRKLLIVGGIITAVLSIGLVIASRNYYERNLLPLSNSQSTILVTIEPGSTLQEIGVLLKENELIRNNRVFEQYVRNKGAQEQLKAGTYSLRPSQSVPEIVDILSEGHVKDDLFTVLPEQRVDQIKSAMINAGFDAEAVDDAFDANNYRNHPALVDKPENASLEGYLYPESFRRTAATTPESIVRQSLDQMRGYLTPQLRAGFVEQGLTVHQGIILASIVEREVGDPDEREQAAQVFLRRLGKGMKLESDATASYGAVLDGEAPSLSYDSAYNTYIHDGLPPSPISNVTVSSLRAVANPANTDWLYFVSGDDGNTYFSRTLEEHEELTRRHCTELCGL